MNREIIEGGILSSHHLTISSGSCGLAVVKHDAGFYLVFTALLVGLHPYHGALGYRRVRPDDGFNFKGRDIFPRLRNASFTRSTK